MQFCRQWLLRFLASIGLGALLLAGGLYLFREKVATWALKHALSSPTVQVSSVAVEWSRLTEPQLQKVGLRAFGQSAEINEITTRWSTAPLPQLKEVELKGLALSLDLEPLYAALQKPAPPDTSPAPEWPLPPLERFRADVSLSIDLRGESEPLALESTWSIVGEDTLVGETRWSSASLQGKATAGLHWPTREGQIQAAQLNLDLAPWWRRLVALEPSLPSDLEWQGQLGVTGEGRLARTEPAASFAFDLSSRLLWPSHGLNVEGIKAVGQGSWRDGLLRWSIPEGLQIQEFRFPGESARDIKLVAQGDSSGLVELSSFSAEVFGGAVSVVPLQTRWPSEPLEAVVQIKHLDLARLSTWLGELQAQVTGSVSGEVRVRLSPQNQFTLIGGGVRLDASTPATLRLQQKGLLTGGLDPSHLAYRPLSQVESGLLNLALKSLEARFLPTSNDQDKSVDLVLTAEPQDPNVKAPVTLNLAVRGPVSQLITAALKRNFSVRSASAAKP